MAVPTNTLQTFGNKAIKESLDSVAYRISPTETPFVMAIGKGKADSTTHQWMTVDLANANPDNAKVEGDDAAPGVANTGVRMMAFTQISEKSVVVSGSAEAADSVSNLTSIAEQVAMKTLELRKDVEAAILSNKAANPGGAGVARVAASFGSYLTSNVNRGVGGASGTLSEGTSGYVNAGATDGATRPFTESMLKGIVAKCWDAGATPKLIFTGSAGKQTISGFTGNATAYRDVVDRTLTAAVDVYTSDFGELAVVPCRHIRQGREALVIDPTKASVDWYRPVKQKELAVTGDSIKRQILGEWTLKVHNEKAHGIIADIA